MERDLSTTMILQNTIAMMMAHGDVKTTVKKLIDIGFINKEDVVIFDNPYDVYKIVEKGLMNND